MVLLFFFFFCFFRLVNFSIGNNESLERFDFFEWKSKIEIFRHRGTNTAIWMDLESGIFLSDNYGAYAWMRLD